MNSSSIMNEEYERYLALLRQREEERILNTNLEDNLLNEFLDNFEREEAEENVILCEHAENYERELEEENRLLCENADNFEREHLKRPAEILSEVIQEGGIIDYFDIEIIPERVNRNFEVRELAFRLNLRIYHQK